MNKVIGISAKNRLQTLALILLFTLISSSISIILPCFGQADSQATRGIKRSSPLTAKLLLTGMGALGQNGALSLTASALIPLTGVEMEVLLPSGLAKVHGSLKWTGDISQGQTATIEAEVRAETEGNWVIKGSAKSSDMGHGYTDTLYVSISRERVEISETNPIISDKVETGSLRGTEKSQESAASLLASGTLTVCGYWYFEEEDNVTVRAVRRARVELWDSDLWGLINYHLATTYTDNNGYFEFPAVENSDGFMEGTLDIFVKIFTDDSVIWVSTTGGALYYGETPVENDVPDGIHDMGSLVLVGTLRGSFGIFDTLLIGYDYAQSLGYAHTDVQAKWPSDRTYNELNGITINFVDGDEWDEDVILHEYGHSVQHSIYGEWIPGSGGLHFWDLPTNINFSFSEGWPTFWGVAANLEMGYGDSLYPRDTWYRDHVDQVINHDLETDPHTPGDDVEGAIACLLWDLFDMHSDGRDNLVATMTPPWDVVTNYVTGGHHAYSIHQFWDGWLARGWNVINDLWGIYFDHGIQKDFWPPSNPTGWSSSHSINVWSNDNTIYMNWWGDYDNVSGVHGYSFTWSTSSTTLPDTALDTTATATTSSALADGNNWYFHIRTVDYAGIWNPSALHVGPFRVDTGAPSNPTGWSSSHAVGQYSTDRTIEMTWWGASDSMSGTYGYSYSWTIFPGTLPDTTVETTGTSTTSSVLADGSWYFHVRTRDNADNWNPSAFHVGPFYITDGGGGGGCPYVYTWNGTSYVKDNNILPASEIGNGTDTSDYYRLEQPLEALLQNQQGTLYSLQIREFEHEHDYIDQVRLIAVDHSQGTSIAVTPEGEIVTYRNPASPVSCIDNHGNNRLNEIGRMDGNVSDPATYFQGYKSDWLVLDFGRVTAANAKLILRGDQKCADICIEVQVLDANGGWQTVEVLHPRDFWAMEAVNMSAYVPANGDFMIRLLWTATHRLDYVGLDTTPQDQFELHQASPVLAIHSVYGNALRKLLANDQVYAELVPGQQIRLAFVLPSNQNQERTFILYTDGHYVKIA